MTQVEAAKLILKHGSCRGISCSEACPCTFSICSHGFAKTGGGPSGKDDLTDAGRAWFKRWLSEHGEEGGESKEGKPVERFEVGKWYKYCGPEINNGISRESCADWEARKAFQCSESDGTSARFRGLRDNCFWSYGNIVQYFREVPPPSEGDGRMEKGPGVLQGTLVEVKINPSQICRIMGLPLSLGVVALEGSLVSQRRRMRASLISRI